MVILGVYMFVLILMIAGIGVDLMRFERDRAALQYTLDRAVLAAADLDQTLAPQAVVEDYFAKSGMTDFLASVTVNQGLSYRTVNATASSNVKTQFMHMAGVSQLEAPAAGTAEERIDGLEISMVLDVSGSMNWNNRLPNLKNAAVEFVEEMARNSEDDKLSISIIPYAAQVAAPDEFIKHYNISDEHSYSNCVHFKGSDFESTSISDTAPLKRAMHFDPWRDFDGRDETPKSLVQMPVCSHRPDREMMVLQKDTEKLSTFIRNLYAAGNTSIDVGMKWASALLDPGTRPVIRKMVAEETVSSDFSQRPHNYDSADTLKVIVVMTDGQNTSQYYMDDAYRNGPSNIWWNDQEKRYSVYNPDTGNYWWVQNGGGNWADHPYGQDGYGCVYNSSYGWDCRNRTEPGSATRLNYPDLWAYTSMKNHVYKMYYPWMNSNSAWSKWYSQARRYVGTSTKNTRTRAICNAIKAQNVVVYTIAFEAPEGGKSLLRDCASAPAYYFDANGIEISDAFSSIASSIRKLRLTQ